MKIKNEKILPFDRFEITKIKLGRPPQIKPLIAKNNLFKQCQVCKKFKDKRDFTAHGSSRDGLNHTCVECRAMGRKNRTYETNRTY